MIVAMRAYRLHDAAIMPIHSADRAACFQLSALIENPEGEHIGPGGRYIARTGLKINVPGNWVIELYARRAQNLTGPTHLGTKVGLLDFSFIDEVTIELINDGPSVVRIMHGDIIADGLLTQVHGARFIDAALLDAVPEVPVA